MLHCFIAYYGNCTCIALLCSIKSYWLPGLCKMYPRVGLRAALQAYDTRMFVIRKIGLHHALYKGKL